MNRILLLIIVGTAIVFTLLHSCKKDKPIEFTWKGHLYKGMGDEPLSNQTLRLELWKRGSLGAGGGGVEIIGQATTDQNGWFEIKYNQVPRSTPPDTRYEEGLYLEMVKPSLPVTNTNLVNKVPWNINIERDFAEINHSRILVNVTFNSPILPDSFYFTYDFPVQDQFSQTRFLNCKNASYHIKTVPVTSNKLEILSKLEIGGAWNNVSTVELGLAYGTSLLDLEKAMCSKQIDSIPDGYNMAIYNPRGFPKIDTINIAVP